MTVATKIIQNLYSYATLISHLVQWMAALLHLIPVLHWQNSGHAYQNDFSGFELFMNTRGIGLGATTLIAICLDALKEWPLGGVHPSD